MRYFYDGKLEFIGYTADEVDENGNIIDSLLPNGAIGFTKNDPLKAGYYSGPFIYDESKNSWVGLTEEQFKQLPELSIQPTDTDQLKTMVGTLVAENAKKDQSIKQLQTMAGTLVAQLAELQKGSN